MATEQVWSERIDPEQAELGLDNMIDDWAKRNEVSDYVIVDILLRQLLKFHLREICRKHLEAI